MTWGHCLRQCGLGVYVVVMVMARAVPLIFVCIESGRVWTLPLSR